MNTPAGNTIATAELTFTHILCGARPVPQAAASMKKGEWDRKSFSGIELFKKTLGIVGLGRIGKRMAHVSRNVFERVIACDPYLIDGDFPAYVERADLAGLFAASDVVSLHVPLNAETRNMIDARVLAGMKPGSYLVNTARGAVLDVGAALAALDRGTLAGLGLDVLPTEPVPRDSPLVHHPRVIVTPHSAFYSVESERDLRVKAARNLVTWLATGRPDYVVTTGTRKP
jgi:phosphoglycerate dehydrogenase-like enzyme